MARKTVRVVITSPEIDKKINKENIKLGEQFLREKSSRVSPLTIKNYRSDLKIFFSWNYLENKNKFFVDIKKLDLSAFFFYVVENMHWGSARVNRMRSALSSLSVFIERFLDDEYEDFRNIVLRAIESAPKSVRREKTILTDEQIERLLVHYKEEDSQIACWLALAVGCGSRFAELLRFEVDMISHGEVVFDGIFLETSRPIQSKGRGRDGKMLTKYIVRDIFMDYYDEWMIEREKIMDENKKEHNFLFIKKNGDPAVEGTVRSWIRSLEKFIGIDFYAHSLRNYLVTYLSKKDIPHSLIQELIGWESIEMVGVYDNSSMKDKKWKELENLKSQ